VIGGGPDGIFAWYPGSTKQRVQLPAPADQVSAITTLNGKIFLGTSDGLFLWAFPGGGVQKIPKTPNHIHALATAGLELLIGAEDGVFQLNQSGNLEQLLTTDGLRTLLSYKDHIVVGTTAGFSILQAPGVEPPRGKSTTPHVEVLATHYSRNVLWFGTSEGLLLLDHNSDQPRLVDRRLGRVTAIQSVGNWLIVGDDSGVLVSRDPRGSGFQRMSLETGAVHCLMAIGDDLWIGADTGVFHVNGFETPWDPGLAILNDIPSFIATDYTLTVSWRVAHYSYRTTPTLIAQQIILTDPTGSLEALPDNGRVPQGAFTYRLPALKGGDYAIQIKVTDLLGNAAKSPPLHFTVRRTPASTISFIAKACGLIYAVVTGVVFTVLVILAKSSQRALDLLTETRILKLALYFELAIRYVPAVRIRIFTRYFDGLKRCSEFNERFLDQLLEDAVEGRKVPSSNIYGLIRSARAICVKGPPGSGKSALANHFIASYIQELDLDAAWKTHHFIPIPIPLRHATTPDLSELARRTVQSYGVTFQDPAVFDRLLDSGGFLLLLDGLNEVPNQRDLIEYARTHPRTYFLLTSQTSSGEAIHEYTLPPVSGKAARTLFEFLLNDADLQTAVPTELWDSIQSAYDVTILVHIVKNNGIVPPDRLGLYSARLASLTATSRRADLVDVLCRTAWTLWKAGERRFDESASLPRDALLEARTARIIVPRGEHYEFEHDLIAAYLAARWITTCASGTQITVSRLMDGDIWNLTPAAQDLVFSFVAQLIRQPEELTALYAFAVTEPLKRVRLLTALTSAAALMQLELSVVPTFLQGRLRSTSCGDAQA
jgi:hypothetical protein